MEYQLEIYRPGSCASDAVIKVFMAPAPFEPIRVGDLLNTKTWGKEVEWPLLRVVSVEHAISESSSVGIDPAGRFTHRVFLCTESVPDTTETRCKPARTI